jgi:glutathione S-transferase kappa 1
VKEKFSQDIFEKTWIHLFHCMWVDHINVTILEDLAKCLNQTGFFSNGEIETIVKAASEMEWKDRLTANTKNALELGAFGAPWHWVRNSEGKEEPFFGSDR